MTPDEMVADLRAKIDKMGAVNMMAIDQFDDLESRHTFLTAQRKDLVDAIASTGEAIKKIDKTTRERFREAFAIINSNFEGTFTTCSAAARRLILLDENDQLESGIDIVAMPPVIASERGSCCRGERRDRDGADVAISIPPEPFLPAREIDGPT